MGAWGTGIFQDDTACDVRDDYRRYVGDGLSGPEATVSILRDYASSLDDAEQAGVVWLALAATQWRCGRLESGTREQALRVIDGSSDLERWKDSPPDRKRRAAALEKLRAQLMSPQPAARKISRQVLATCDWSIGDVIAFRLLSGKLALFRMIARHTDKGGTSPICELLDWTGDAVPPPEELGNLRLRVSRQRFWERTTRLILLGSNRLVKERLQRLPTASTPLQTGSVPATAVFWKKLDTVLAEKFDLH